MSRQKYLTIIDCLKGSEWYLPLLFVSFVVYGEEYLGLFMNLLRDVLPLKIVLWVRLLLCGWCREDFVGAVGMLLWGSSEGSDAKVLLWLPLVENPFLVV